MIDLGESAALLGVEVDVVDPEGGVREAEGSRVRVGDVQIAEVVELDVYLDLVVLEGDEGEGKAGVSAEPELEGDVDAGLGLGATLDAEGLWQLADHFFVSDLLSGGDGELAPDLEPVAVVLVDALSTDFDLDVVHDKVADGVDPAEAGGVGVVDADGGQRGLQVDAVDEVAVSRNSACDSSTEIRVSVECLFDGLHGKVGVATVDDFKVGNLRVSSEIDILGTVGDKLH